MGAGVGGASAVVQVEPLESGSPGPLTMGGEAALAAPSVRAPLFEESGAAFLAERMGSDALTISGAFRAVEDAALEHGLDEVNYLASDGRRIQNTSQVSLSEH